MNLHVVEMSSVHHWQDNRIFRRDSRSLARSGHRVTLLAAGGPLDEVIDGVHVIADAPRGGRVRRLALGLPALLRRALRVNPDVYHLHDPELGVLIPFLRRRGAAVVYDAHEDLPSQILAKPYLPVAVRPLLAWLSVLFLRVLDRSTDQVVAATPTVARRFTSASTTVVHNYPEILDAPALVDVPEVRDEAIYVGRVSRTRGITTLLDAVERASLPESWRVSVIGPWASEELRTEARRHPAADRFDIVGPVHPLAARARMDQARVGLALLHPTPAYRDALPTKLFEYMAAGLPVIASDFPRWREIVEPSGCGLLVDPEDPGAVADALLQIASEPDRAREMGERGREAVARLYSWRREESRLLSAIEDAARHRGSGFSGRRS